MRTLTALFVIMLIAISSSAFAQGQKTSPESCTERCLQNCKGHHHHPNACMQKCPGDCELRRSERRQRGLPPR